MSTLANARCVVLGGAGFLGMNLCRDLVGKVKHLRAVGRRSRPDGLPDDVEWIQGDFADAQAVAGAVAGCDVVFHLINASTPASANSNMVADVQNNVLCSLALLQACRNASVRRLVFVSSGGTIYGIPSVLPTPEDAPTSPITAYGISKLSIEKYLYLYEFAYGLSYRVLRVANPFGPYQTAAKGQGVIAAFMQSTLLGCPIEIWGDGTIVRDYIYVDDVSRALIAAATHEGADRVFNVGSGKGKSLIEIVSTIEQALGRPIEVRFREGRKVDVPVSILDIHRAAVGLSWTPEADFEAAIATTLAWYQQHHPKCYE
jgi:UDP-glucose 4-epimerase